MAIQQLREPTKNLAGVSQPITKITKMGVLQQFNLIGGPAIHPSNWPCHSS